MKHLAALIAALTATGALQAQNTDMAFPADMTLWYTTPAVQWEETLPLGNGRLGMMPYGNPFDEKIVLNEISMWSGSKACYDNPAAAKSLPEIQRLLVEGKNLEAQELMYSTFVPTKTTDLGTYGSYQMLADLDTPLDHVVALEAARDVLLERMKKRAAEQGRADDTPEAIAKRLETYEKETAPLLDIYEARGLLVVVNGVGDIDEISGRIISHLE